MQRIAVKPNVGIVPMLLIMPILPTSRHFAKLPVFRRRSICTTLCVSPVISPFAGPTHAIVRLLRLSLASIVLAMVITPAKGDGVVRDGVGAISTARGGTNLGFADNAAIILDNPAGCRTSATAGSGSWALTP